MATQKDIDAVEAKVNEIVEESVKFAEASNYPDPSEAMKDVYAQSDYPYITD